MSFVNLHVHDKYSLLGGMGTPKEYATLAKQIGQPALAITNTGNLFNAYEFWTACKEVKIKHIFGIEFYLAEKDNMLVKDGKNQFKIVALAKNQAGWNNLMRLSTMAYLEGRHYVPRIDTARLIQYGEGLIILSSGLDGQIGAKWKKGEESGAMNIARRYRDAFKDDFYLEVMPHDSYEQSDLNKFLFEMSKLDGFKIVAANDCRFPTPDKAEYYDYLYLIDGNGRDDISKLPRKRYLRGREEMAYDFVAQGFPEAVVASWLDRTLAIADSIEPIVFKTDFKLPVFYESQVDVMVPQGSPIGIGSTGIGVLDDDEEDQLF